MLKPSPSVWPLLLPFTRSTPPHTDNTSVFKGNLKTTAGCVSPFHGRLDKTFLTGYVDKLPAEIQVSTPVLEAFARKWTCLCIFEHNPVL
jgi:hypothetical protein